MHGPAVRGAHCWSADDTTGSSLNVRTASRAAPHDLALCALKTQHASLSYKQPNQGQLGENSTQGPAYSFECSHHPTISKTTTSPCQIRMDMNTSLETSFLIAAFAQKRVSDRQRRLLHSTATYAISNSQKTVRNVCSRLNDSIHQRFRFNSLASARALPHLATPSSMSRQPTPCSLAQALTGLWTSPQAGLLPYPGY